MADFADNKWVEIDTQAIKNNIQAIQNELKAESRLIAVIKANAYGHGAVELARILCQNGIDFFGLTYLEEALEIRQAGLTTDILLFSPLINFRYLPVVTG